MSSQDITQEFQSNYKYAHDFWAPYVTNTKIYTDATAGKTWSKAELDRLAKEGREPIEFNIQRRTLQFFSGYLRDNLNAVVYKPVEGSDEKASEQFTDVGMQIWEKNHGYTTFLDAYDEAFKSGQALCGLRMDYSKDFVNGDITFYKRCFNQYFLDPTWSKMDLRDCGFAIMRDLITKEYAKQLLLNEVDPKEIDSIGFGFRDNKFMNYQPEFKTLSRQRNLLAYDQYYARTTRRREFIVDKRSGFSRDITDMEKDEKDVLKMGMRRLLNMRKEMIEAGEDVSQIPDVEIRWVERPYVQLHVMLNGQHVYTGEDDTGIVETYPFVPCICYMEPSIWDPSYRIQGMGATTYSLQRQFNKRHMKIQDMIDSDISTGYAYLIGSVRDTTDLQQSGQNKLVGVESDPDINPHGLDAIRELNGGNANTSAMAYADLLDKLSLTLGNVTEATLGTDEKRNTLVSGRLAQVQIAQNLITNRKVFDNVDQSQLLLGGIVLRAIQLNYPYEKIERMINEEPAEQFYDKNFEQYDVVTSEGVRSRTQKDAYYYELINLARDGLVDVPQSAIVDALSMTGITKLKEKIEEREQQQAQQQEKVNAMEIAQLELLNSQKEENVALAQERRARVISDIALSEERASEAEQNRAQAALDKAKTITEIASMEDERLLRVLEFVRSLEAEEIADREAVANKIVSTADSINTETEGSAENQRLSAAVSQIEEASNAEER